MKEFIYTITEPQGIHARPAGLLAKTAKSFGDTVVTVTKAGSTVKASQLMEPMGLRVKQGGRPQGGAVRTGGLHRRRDWPGGH